MLARRFHLRRSFQRTMATVAKASTSPGVVRPSAHEINRSRLDARNLEVAVRHIHQDGLVVIDNVVPHNDIDRLNTKMVQDARTLQARGNDGPFNYNLGNLQQDAPPVAEHFYPSIFASKSTPATNLQTRQLTNTQIPLRRKSPRQCLALDQSGRFAQPILPCLHCPVPRPSDSRYTQTQTLRTLSTPLLWWSTFHLSP